MVLRKFRNRHDSPWIEASEMRRLYKPKSLQTARCTEFYSSQGALTHLSFTITWDYYIHLKLHGLSWKIMYWLKCKLLSYYHLPSGRIGTAKSLPYETHQFNPLYIYPWAQIEKARKGLWRHIRQSLPLRRSVYGTRVFTDYNIRNNVVNAIWTPFKSCFPDYENSKCLVQTNAYLSRF